MPLPVIAVSTLSALVGALAGAEPTGVGWWDMILAAVVAGIVPMCAYSGKRWSWLLFGAVATAFAGLDLWTFAGAICLGVALWMVVSDWRDGLFGSVAIAIGMQSLLRLPQNFFFGFESLVAGIAIAAVMATGYRYARRRSRRVAKQVLIGVGAISFAAVVLTGLVVLAGRGPAQAGVSAAQFGLQSARQGDVGQTLEHLDRAQRSFTDADGVFSAVWSSPTRLVPVVGQHIEVLGAASRQGKTLAAVAASAVRDANLDDISLEQGRVDVGLLTEIAPELDRLADEMAAAQIDLGADRSPWLIKPVEDRIDALVDELDRAIPEAQLAAEASTVVPGLLGAEATQRYLVLFGSPAESRELGGFVGSWALVDATDGALTKVDSGRAYDIYDLARAGELDDAAGYPTLFELTNPGQWPQNLTSMPQIAEVARAARDLFPTFQGAPIDGVVYLDPYVIAALLQLAGPVTVEGVDVVLSSDNVAQFLIEDQYGLFPEPEERFSFLADVLDATFEALTTSNLPGPEQLGSVLGPLAREGRLQMATYDDAANAFLAETWLLQSFPEPGGDDFLSVVQTNARANKLDAFLTRDVTYRVINDPATGSFTGEVVVDLSLDAPDTVPAYMLGGRIDEVEPGEHVVLVSIYTPHELELAQVNGEPALAVAEDEFGYRRYQVPVDLHVDGPTTGSASFVLSGQLEPGEDYRLTMANQPVVHRDDVSIEVTNPATGEATTARIELDQDLLLIWPPPAQ